MWKREEEQYQRAEVKGVMMLTLKVEEGATSQGIHKVSKGWKRQDPILEASERKISMNTSMLAKWDTFWTSGPPELYHHICVLFKIMKFVEDCYSSNGNSTLLQRILWKLTKELICIKSLELCLTWLVLYIISGIEITKREREKLNSYKTNQSA